MVKTAVNWTFGESPIPSAKENEAIVDYITAGQNWINDSGTTNIHVATGEGSQLIIASEFPVGIAPYNPTKSLWDTVRIAWRCEAGASSGVAVAPDVEYTVNAGTAWTAVVDTLGFPVANVAGQVANVDGVGTTDINEGMTNIPLSAIAVPTWVGVRLDNGTAGTDSVTQGAAYISWFVKATFFLSTTGFDPF